MRSSMLGALWSLKLESGVRKEGRADVEAPDYCYNWENLEASGGK